MSGRKLIRERFSLCLTMNAAGTCRLKPTVIYRAKKPRAYKRQDMNKLNVHWMTSKKGYMSAKLSQDWMKDTFIPQVKKFCSHNNIRFNILLFLDKAPGHSPLLQTDPNIKVEFLPPNTTSLIQPLDQEVISVVKAKYSKHQLRTLKDATKDDEVLQQLVDNSEEDDETSEEQVRADNEHEKQVLLYWKNYNIKNAVDLVVECWDSITQRTINHGWRNLLEHLPEDRRGNVAGEPQSVQLEVDAAVAEAREIPGTGFDATTEDDIIDMIRPAPPTTAELIEEE